MVKIHVAVEASGKRFASRFDRGGEHLRWYPRESRPVPCLHHPGWNIQAQASLAVPIGLTKNGLAEPVVDELASAQLDLWARERG